MTPLSERIIIPGEDTMRSTIVSEASLSTRFKQWWTSIPFVTAAVLGLCVVVFCIDVLTGFGSFENICMSPSIMVSTLQLYRPFTSVIFHGGLLHIAFNMLAFVPMGGALERQLGSVRYAFLLLLFSTTNGVIDVILSYAAASVPFIGYQGLLYECCIGFSGVIFALIVVETYTSNVQNRSRSGPTYSHLGGCVVICSIFGFFTLPPKLYPWALLVLFQLLIPAVSFIGHLSGIISGLAYTHGLLNRVMPTSSLCSVVESSGMISSLVRKPGFIVGGSATPTSIPTFVEAASHHASTSASSAWRKLQSFFPPQTPPQSTGTAGERPDPKFPGTGRTLAASTPPPTLGPPAEGKAVQIPPSAPPPHPSASAVAAALNRSSRGGVGSREAPPPAVDGSGLVALAAMGFEKDRAKAALSASGGNIDMAVDILSAAS